MKYLVVVIALVFNVFTAHAQMAPVAAESKPKPAPAAAAAEPKPPTAAPSLAKLEMVMSNEALTKLLGAQTAAILDLSEKLRVLEERLAQIESKAKK